MLGFQTDRSLVFELSEPWHGAMLLYFRPPECSRRKSQVALSESCVWAAAGTVKIARIGFLKEHRFLGSDAGRSVGQIESDPFSTVPSTLNA